jgi:hypothetical protein
MFYLRQPAEKKRRKTNIMNKPEPTTNAAEYGQLSNELREVIEALNTSKFLPFNYNLEPRYDKTSRSQLLEAYNFTQERRTLAVRADILLSKLSTLIDQGADKEWFAHQRDLNAYWYAQESAA